MLVNKGSMMEDIMRMVTTEVKFVGNSIRASNPPLTINKLMARTPSLNRSKDSIERL